jgi:hypothetical protein
MFSVSKPRTELLTRINFILKRPPTLREPSHCKTITLNYIDLIEAGVCPKKLQCLNLFPEYTLVCICQLANCCANVNACSYCKYICSFEHVEYDIWTAQPDIHFYTIIQNNTKTDVVVQPVAFEQDDSIVETFQYVPVVIQGDKKYKPVCKYGDSCRFLTMSICHYRHE